MPLVRIKDIREMSSENRGKRLGEFRTELVRLKTMIGAGGTVENPARVKMLRKAIAKIMTIEHEQTLRTGQTEKKEKELEKAEKKTKKAEKKTEKKAEEETKEKKAKKTRKRKEK